jgi:hypothetical protein
MPNPAGGRGNSSGGPSWLEGYVEVAERIEKLKVQHPESRIETEIVWQDD